MIEPFFLLMRWFQTVPIAMLMLVPFEDSELRVRRHVGWMFSVLYMLLTSVLMAVISPMSSIDGQRNMITRDLGLAVVLVCYFFWWVHTIHAPAAHKLLMAVIMLHYAAFLNAASNMVSSLILGENYVEKINGEAGSLTFDLYLLASTMITWPLVWYFLRHVLRKNLPVLDDRQIRRGVSYICVIFLMFAVVTYNPPYDKKLEMFVVIGAMVVTDMLAYYIFFQEIGIARRQETALRMFERYQMQYQEIISRVEEVRRLRHDMRHHLTTLGALNAQGKQAEIADYLKQYGSVYDQLEELELCGDPVTGSILSYYLIQAKEEGVVVKCNCALRGDTIDPMDMTVLLGNCMENAMETLRQVPLEKRRLDIDIRTSGGMLLLQIINSSVAMSDTEGFVGWDQFPSGKRRGRRGVGLQSVADSAQKYGGSARFQQKDGLFTVHVLLNLP